MSGTRIAGPAGPRVWSVGAARLLVDVRAAVVTGVLLAMTVALIFVTLGTGPFPAGPADVVRTIAGAGDGALEFAVLDIGLPRALTALLVGAALGAAGALVQSLTRNPLGSPDVIGFDSGVATGALVAIIVLGLPATGRGVLAALGGILAAGLVYLLSTGGADSGYRIVLIGIGAAAMLDSVNAYLLTRSRATESLSALRWLVGSLNGGTWNSVYLAGAGVTVFVPVAIGCSRHLRSLQVGTDLATAVGARVGRVVAMTLLTAVGLSTMAVLAAGPISFVALTAPQLAARLTGARREPQPVAAAAMGAVLLLSSDLLGQRAFGQTDLPVGVVTGALGGGYLAWLLARQWRRQTR